jgi:hypothetical protein
MSYVVAAGDVRALVGSAEVLDLAEKLRLSPAVVAREMEAAREAFARTNTRREVTSILNRGNFGMACSTSDVMSETRRRLAGLEFGAQYAEPASVTWLDQLPPRAQTQTYTLSSRLDVDLRAGNEAP